VSITRGLVNWMGERKKCAALNEKMEIYLEKKGAVRREEFDASAEGQGEKNADIPVSKPAGCQNYACHPKETGGGHLRKESTEGGNSNHARQRPTIRLCTLGVKGKEWGRKGSEKLERRREFWPLGVKPGGK